MITHTGFKGLIQQTYTGLENSFSLKKVWQSCLMLSNKVAPHNVYVLWFNNIYKGIKNKGKY